MCLHHEAENNALLEILGSAEATSFVPFEFRQQGTVQSQSAVAFFSCSHCNTQQRMDNPFPAEAI